MAPNRPPPPKMAAAAAAASTPSQKKYQKKSQKKLTARRPRSPPVELFRGPAPEVGPGWTKSIVERRSGKYRGQQDRYWFSPRTQRKFRSLAEVRRYMDVLEEAGACGGGEREDEAEDRAWAAASMPGSVATIKTAGAKKAALTVRAKTPAGYAGVLPSPYLPGKSHVGSAAAPPDLYEGRGDDSDVDVDAEAGLQLLACSETLPPHDAPLFSNDEDSGEEEGLGGGGGGGMGGGNALAVAAISLSRARAAEVAAAVAERSAAAARRMRRRPAPQASTPTAGRTLGTAAAPPPPPQLRTRYGRLPMRQPTPPPPPLPATPPAHREGGSDEAAEPAAALAASSAAAAPSAGRHPIAARPVDPPAVGRKRKAADAVASAVAPKKRARRPKPDLDYEGEEDSAAFAESAAAAAVPFLAPSAASAVTADLIHSTEFLAFSWDALRLGTQLGTAALNAYLSEVAGGPRGGERRGPLTAVQALQIVSTLRTRTIPPPAGSALHDVVRRDPTRLGTDGGQLSPGDDDEDDDNDEDGNDESSDEDDEEEEVPPPPLLPPPESSPSGDGSGPSLPLPVLTRLYRLLCDQDADDGSTGRREAHYLTADACAARLRALENRACDLRARRRAVEEAGRALGLDGSASMRDEVRWRMGYRTRGEVMAVPPMAAMTVAPQQHMVVGRTQPVLARIQPRWQ